MLRLTVHRHTVTKKVVRCLLLRFSRRFTEGHKDRAIRVQMDGSMQRHITVYG
jgi:ABC-type taurine transport system ATPase subunit